MLNYILAAILTGVIVWWPFEVFYGTPPSEQPYFFHKLVMLFVAETVLLSLVYLLLR